MPNDFTDTSDYEGMLEALRRFSDQVNRYDDELRGHVIELFTEARDKYIELRQKNEEEEPVDAETLQQIAVLMDKCVDSSERLQRFIRALIEADELEQTDRTIKKLIETIENYVQTSVK